MDAHEFNSRIEAQRAILKVVNAHPAASEQLASLTRRSIDRWVRANRLDADSRLVLLLIEASAGLFFLANRSQAPISDEYLSESAHIAALCGEIGNELAVAASA